MKKRKDASNEPDNEPSSSKLTCLDGPSQSVYAFDDPALQVVDIASIHDELDEREWIVAECFMKFGAKASKLRRYVMRTEQFKIFDVELHGPEVMQDSFDTCIALKDRVCFSLKGASLKSKTASGYLNFTLVYKDGVQFKIIAANGNPERNGLVFDAWKLREEAQELEEKKRLATNDWFATPVQSEADFEDAEPMDCDPEPDLESAPSASSSHTLDSTPTLQMPTEIAVPRPSSLEEKSNNNGKSSREAGSSRAVENSATETNDLSTSVKGNDKRKRIRKSDTRHAKNSGSGSKQSAKRKHADGGESDIKPNGRTDNTDGRGRKRNKKKHRRAWTPTPSPPRPTRNPALDLRAGIQGQTHNYPALDNLKSFSTVSLIVVVVGCSEVRFSKTGDHYITLSVVDPSNYHSYFSINVFADKQCANWLPRLDYGHVVLLHNVKVTCFKDDTDRLNGVIYKDKICWAAFNPETGRFYHNEEAGTPTQSQTPKSSFNAFTVSALRPFYRPHDEKEIEYCSSIGEWWRAVKEEEERTRVSAAAAPRVPKEHRLIGDMEVDQFFDATVEVIRIGEVEDRGQRIVVVSDYTMHKQLGHGGEMGPYGHTTFTDKVPEEVVEEIKENGSGEGGRGGTFWRLRNVRLKINSNGHVELDLYKAKWGMLDEDQDEPDEHLEKLFERKKSYEVSPYNPDYVNAAENGEVSLVSQVVDKQCVNLTAEILFVSREREIACDLYVTDYTACEGGSLYRPPTMQRTVGSNVPLFKIIIWRSKTQEESSVELTVGSIYKFLNVRVGDDGRGCLVGHLYGAMESVRKVTVKGSDADDVLELKRRKREFYGTEGNDPIRPAQAQDTSACAAERNEAVAKVCAVEVKTLPVDLFTVHTWHTDQPQNMIKEIKQSTKCPNKFKLVARVVDYYPLEISQFAWKRCKACRKRIHEMARACLDCGDMEHKYVEWKYRFFLRLEDECGDRLDVSVCDEADAFLNGLKPTDFSSDPNALRQLRLRLETLFGNLEEVHEGLQKNKIVEPKYGPFFELAVKSWSVRIDGKQTCAYALTGCSMRGVEKSRRGNK